MNVYLLRLVPDTQTHINHVVEFNLFSPLSVCVRAFVRLCACKLACVCVCVRACVCARKERIIHSSQVFSYCIIITAKD